MTFGKEVRIANRAKMYWIYLLCSQHATDTDVHIKISQVFFYCKALNDRSHACTWRPVIPVCTKIRTFTMIEFLVAVFAGETFTGLTLSCQLGKKKELLTGLGPTPVSNRLGIVWSVSAVTPPDISITWIGFWKSDNITILSLQDVDPREVQVLDLWVDLISTRFNIG